MLRLEQENNIERKMAQNRELRVSKKCLLLSFPLVKYGSQVIKTRQKWKGTEVLTFTRM